MNVLGFSNESHDTSAAIVCDGQLLVAAEEERLTRRKHDDAFPLRAIDFCLHSAGLRMADIDVIAVPDKPYRSGTDSYLAEIELSQLKRVDGIIRHRRWVHKLALDACLRLGATFNWQMNPWVSSGLALLRQHYSELPEIRYYDHHRCHAAAAYFTSGSDRSAVVTIDYNGGPYSTVTWLGEGLRLTRLRVEFRNNSLGEFYWDCTRYLGFSPSQEGKTMGLAGRGNREVLDGPVSKILDTSSAAWYEYRKPFLKRDVLGFEARNGQSIVEPPYPDFASAVQSALQLAVEKVVRSAIADAECNSLCLGGGVMLNCSSNGALSDSGAASSVWVFPASGDAGLSAGAALLCSAESGKLVRDRPLHAYLGPDFGSCEYEAALRDVAEITFQRVDGIAEEVARCLAAGEVVGWFQGRMEFGPRALGNRSILADPRRVEMRDRVNRIKRREMWRPLSPVILAERASEFFHLAAPSPFMLFATQVRIDKRAVAPAIVHADGSARPQTVTRDQNPCLYDLISAFCQRTEVPVLLNTSFNTAGEPIVCTPQDAVKTFLATEMDVLVMGDYMARRQPRSELIGSAHAQ